MINYVRNLVEIRLNSIKTQFNIQDVGYRRASDQKLFPHVVWEIISITPLDMGRSDFTIDIDVWGRSEVQVFEIMDAIREIFLFRNDPQDTILPTFYETSSGTVEDSDRSIVHGIVRLECQVYAVGATDASILKGV